MLKGSSMKKIMVIALGFGLAVNGLEAAGTGKEGFDLTKTLIDPYTGQLTPEYRGEGLEQPELKRERSLFESLTSSTTSPSSSTDLTKAVFLSPPSGTLDFALWKIKRLEERVSALESKVEAQEVLVEDED
jgi:hypothetical protein